MGIVNLDSWQSHDLRVSVIRNTPESGVERMKRKKEQNRSDEKKYTKKSHFHIRIRKGKQQDKKKIEKLGEIKQ